jgi:hypothetical protein
MSLLKDIFDYPIETVNQVSCQLHGCNCRIVLKLLTKHMCGKVISRSEILEKCLSTTENDL